MEQSHAWEANSSTAIQKNPRISCNPKVHYSVNKIQAFFSVLGQINPLYAIPSHLFSVHLNITLPSKRRSPEWSLSFRVFTSQTVYITLFRPVWHMAGASHPRLFDHPDASWWEVNIAKLSCTIFRVSCYILALKSKFLPPHLILENSRPVYFPQYDWPSSIPV
jgi:hypothetical protein